MGLRLVLDRSLRGRLRAWEVQVSGLRRTERGWAHAELRRLCAELRERHAQSAPSSIPGVEEARRLYRSFGIDPTRTRPSSEALLRRALRGHEIYRIHELVDVGNWVSLEWLLPIGLYDRAKLRGESLTLRVGHEGEAFDGIRKGPVHVAGRLCISDAEGAFGSPTSDSLRSCIEDSTQDVLAVVFAPFDGELARLRGAGEALGNRLAQAGEGRLEISRMIDAEA
jgi:DNA/RNA-binding domain of Phe-tRNA-synthetase-like protein